jgi:hypothetical protein
MRIYLDLDSRRLLTTPTRPLSLLEFKRRDNDSIELQFLRDAAVQELPAGTTARLGIKPDGDYDAAFLAVATLTQSGTGTATVYSGELNLHTTAMATAFADEPVTLSAMLEVEWVTGDVVSSSKTLPTTIHNDVIRGDEGEPVELPFFYTAATSDFKATQAQAEAGTDNATWMTPLRTKQAIAELAATDWDSVSGKPSAFFPSAHTHAIADTTGLQTALDAKAPTSHTHAVADVTGLQSALDGKAATSHTHSLSALTQSSATNGQVATWNGTAWVPQTTEPGVTSYGDLTDVPSTFPPATHNHSAAEITSGTLALARIPTGTTSATVALGNDSRFSDSRTPASHVHGNISNAGAIGTTASLPVITGTSGVLQAGSFGTTAGTFCQGNDSRLLTITGGITAIAVVSTMPATPSATTLYIVT